MLRALRGRKTYLVGVGALLGAAAGVLTGALPLAEGIQLAVIALLGMFTRAGVTTEVRKTKPLAQ